MRNEEIDQLIRSRAAHALKQTRLTVDYYRIRRKLALPLPVTQNWMYHYPMQFRTERYPWTVWQSWALEERLSQLGWCATLFEDEQCKVKTAEELAALAAFPQYDQYNSPDLSFSHSMRTMLVALRHFEWMDDALRQSLIDAGKRALDRISSWLSPTEPGHFLDDETPDDKRQIIKNVGLIGTMMLAAFSRQIGHAKCDYLHTHAMAAIDHLLGQRAIGYTEAVGYDGYVLDFLVDWIAGEPEQVQQSILKHEQMPAWLRESWAVGLPGKVMDLAPLGDVEPIEMPFHASALAKWLNLQDEEESRWFVSRCDLARLRTDGLVAARSLSDSKLQAPVAGVVDAHYALALRTGYEADDVAVITSAARGPINHPQNDAGSIVIGAGGNWVLDDPGYQQFLDTSERVFTTYPPAHNAPIINTVGQTKFGKTKLLQSTSQDDKLAVSLDLTACYELEGLSRVHRHLWLVGDKALVLADEITCDSLAEVAWHWHGHPDAAWWIDDGKALLHTDDADLWLFSPQLQFEQDHLHRMRGSRGQLTLMPNLKTAGPNLTMWWLFVFGESASMHATVEKNELIWQGKYFKIG